MGNYSGFYITITVETCSRALALGQDTSPAPHAAWHREQLKTKTLHPSKV